MLGSHLVAPRRRFAAALHCRAAALLRARATNGTLDSAFGGPQGLFTRIIASSSVTSLLQQADSKIVALGGCANGIGLARYIGP